MKFIKRSEKTVALLALLGGFWGIFLMVKIPDHLHPTPDFVGACAGAGLLFGWIACSAMCKIRIIFDSRPLKLAIASLIFWTCLLSFLLGATFADPTLHTKISRGLTIFLGLWFFAWPALDILYLLELL